MAEEMQPILTQKPSHSGMTASECRRWRQRCRLSQRALARLLHVPHLSVWRLENGRRRITPGGAVRLALLAHTLRPLARHVCPTCGGVGVLNGLCAVDARRLQIVRQSM